MSLSEWYGKREVLLTGVTSELGRNLFEKLLRSFPNIKVHVVLRSRRGLAKVDRIKAHVCSTPGYERLNQERPNALSNVMAYEGNLVYESLGVRKQVHQELANVSIVFHAGGESECLLEYCRKLPKLQAVVIATDMFRTKDDQVVESVLDENLFKNLPLGVVQLPALGPACREPMPGYVERLNGATAVMVGTGYVLGRKDLPAQIIPTDLATNTIILAAWDIFKSGRLEEPKVYNAVTLNCSWGELISKGDRGNKNYRYPTFRIRGMTSSKLLHWIVVFLFEWLPSFICDSIFGIFGRKHQILSEYERVRDILKSFEPVTLRALMVQRQNIFHLEEGLSSQDKESFPVRADIDIEAYILCAAAAVRKYHVDNSSLGIVKFFMPTVFVLLLLSCGYFFFY